MLYNREIIRLDQSVIETGIAGVYLHREEKHHTHNSNPEHDQKQISVISVQIHFNPFSLSNLSVQFNFNARMEMPGEIEGKAFVFKGVKKIEKNYKGIKQPRICRIFYRFVDEQSAIECRIRRLVWQNKGKVKVPLLFDVKLF